MASGALAPAARLWIRPLWSHSGDSSPSEKSENLEMFVLSGILTKENGEPLILGREYVATVGLDRDRPVESVSRKAVSIYTDTNGNIFLDNTSANFIYLYKHGQQQGILLEKGQTKVNLTAGDSFSLSGEFYRVAIESHGPIRVNSIQKDGSRDSLQKFATTLVSSESGGVHRGSSSSSSDAGAAGSSNSIEPQKTEVVIKEKRAPKQAKSNPGAPSASAVSEDRPLAKSASTRHESIVLEYESDSDDDAAAAPNTSPSKPKRDSSPKKQDSPAKSSKKRKERDEEEKSPEGDHADENPEEQEIAPRRSKRQRVELFNMDSILDERDEDVVDEDDFGSKKARAKRGGNKGNKQQEKLEEILAGFSASNFSSNAKLALLYHEECMNHVTPEDHLEQPGRLRVAVEAMKMLQEKFGKKADSTVVEANSWLPVSLDIVTKVHDLDYVNKMRQRAERMQPEDLPRHGTLVSQDFGSQFLSQNDAPKDTFISFGSWNAALLATGGVCKAVDLVCASGDQRKARNAFVAVRPPGHHAGPTGHARSNTQGFCILNNVAIGAKYAMDKFGLQRVAIVDIDVHAGNGTVECVEKEPNILFISLHCEDAYPFDADHTPEMYNLGPNILNVGFKSNPTRRKFFKLFEEQALPRLEAHKPELILISAGFDAHMDDPTGVGALTSKDYIEITEKLKAVADKHSNSRVVSVLEGGYNLDALKQSVLAHICALMKSQANSGGSGAKSKGRKNGAK